MLTDAAILALGLSRADSWLRGLVEPWLRLLYGLGYTDFLILAELDSVQGKRLRPVDLAKRLLLTPSGISRALRPLESLALVERTAHERDARAGYIGLTPDGETRVAQAAATLDGLVAATLGASLSANARLALLAFFERLGYMTAKP